MRWRNLDVVLNDDNADLLNLMVDAVSVWSKAEAVSANDCA